jgi:Protein of unknown function (DUF2628)
MRVYTVHAPPEEIDSPEAFLFVKDGISWPALFFPVLWILWHRMWLTLVYYIVFLLVVAWVGRLGGHEAASIIGALGGILFALEANNFRRMALRARGWIDLGPASGRDYGEAETRFFGEWAGEPDSVSEGEAMARAAYSPQARAQGADEPIFGLFPEPEV